MRTKGYLWGLGAVIAAAVIIYFAVSLPPSSDKEIRGTVGQAERYHQEQIGDEDVVLAEKRPLPVARPW